MDLTVLQSKMVSLFSFFKSKKVIISLISTVVILGALVTGVIYIRQRQGILPAGASSIQLKLVSSSSSIKKGDEFNVDIYIDTKGMSVTGSDIGVKYDSEVLQAESITPGNFLPVIFIPGQVATGLASIVLGCDPTDPKNGNGILATIKFKTLGQGVDTTISLDSATVISALGQTTNVAGTLPTLNIIIAGLPTTTPKAIPTKTPTPTLTPIVTPTGTPPITPTKTPTSAPTLTPTGIPTSTPKSSPTPIVTPTVSPTSSPSSPPTSKPGDVNGDGKVDILDIGEIINNYGKTGSPGWIRSDLNKDGVINMLDIGIVINNYSN